VARAPADPGQTALKGHGWQTVTGFWVRVYWGGVPGSRPFGARRFNPGRGLARWPSK